MNVNINTGVLLFFVEVEVFSFHIKGKGVQH